jgi:hypothetical protein
LQIEINTIRFILGLLNILSLKKFPEKQNCETELELYEKKDGQVLFQILVQIFMGSTASVGLF